MTTAQRPAWIVTGATRGFGRSITETLLRRGDNVLAAVRRPEAMADLVDRYPEQLAVARFDARASEGVDGVVAGATDRFGRVDVLVNNAGRGYLGAAEEITDDELRESLAMHLFVPAALVRAVLPIMRAQASGTIVQLSSQGGRFAFPGVGTYCAAKFALEGWSEALAGEVSPFGIRVVLVEPSRFRTNFNAADALAVAEVSDTYRDVLAAVRANMRGGDGVQEGDPDRAADVIVDLVASGDALPLRLPLGAEAVQRLGDVYRRELANVERWSELARSADHPGTTPAARPI